MSERVVLLKVNERVSLDPHWDHLYVVTAIRGSVISVTDQRTGYRQALHKEKLIPAVAEDRVGIRPRVKGGHRPARYVTLPPPTQTPRPTASAGMDPPRAITPQPQPSRSNGHASSSMKSQWSDVHERPTPMDVEPVSMRTRKSLRHTPDDAFSF